MAPDFRFLSFSKKEKKMRKENSRAQESLGVSWFSFTRTHFPWVGRPTTRNGPNENWSFPIFFFLVADRSFSPLPFCAMREFSSLNKRKYKKILLNSFLNPVLIFLWYLFIEISPPIIAGCKLPLGFIKTEKCINEIRYSVCRVLREIPLLLHFWKRPIIYNEWDFFTLLPFFFLLKTFFPLGKIWDVLKFLI